jgi:23S rRNA C2498 (ribose-2'-O)-methylase RlmM
MTQFNEIQPINDNDLKIQEAENEKILDTLLEHIGMVGGSKSKQFGEMILTQLASSCYLNKKEEDIWINVAIDLKGINPQDHIEGMLATQMIATHYATMKSFSRAAHASSPESRHENLNAANKLTRSFTAQLEALNRYRGKGQQKVTVEHVHVHAGGQAIVGSVTSTKNSSKMEGG